MLRKLVFVGLVFVFSTSVCYGQSLIRTSTASYSHAYAWINLVGSDIEDDSGTGNTDANARVNDSNDPTYGTGYSEADVNAFISPGNQTTHAVGISGYTSVLSYMAGGYTTIGTGVWSPGAVQHFNASAQIELQASGAGGVGHYVGVGIDMGSTTAQGSLYGWATVGDFRVTFSWSGGEDMVVEVFENGQYIDWYTTSCNSSGQFVIVETFGQIVSHGDLVPVHAYAMILDNNNKQMIDKIINITAATN